MKNGKCTSLGDHRFTLNDMDTGALGSHCTNCGITRSEALQKSWSDRYQTVQVHTPHDVDQARNQQLDQLKANAKEHKKHVDRLSEKISQLTQQRDQTAFQLGLKEQEAAFFRAEFERHCDVRKVKVGGCEGYMMQESISPPTMVTALTAWLIGFSVTSGGVTAYALAKWIGVL